MAQTKDILIEQGSIQAIADNIEQKSAKVIEGQGLHVSIGWLDIGVQHGDPGFEHIEDVESLSKAAARGGYTALACYPNTQPRVHSKSEILYIKNNTKHLPVNFYPIGAISKKCAGQDITEMYDMSKAGAVAFSDGSQSVQNSGLMLRALQYVKAFDGLIINHPHDATIAPEGQLHEGIVSTSLGMQGLPHIAEELAVQRDIHLTEYAQSRIHIANISTAKSVDLIRRAKAKGVAITASVAALNLAFSQRELYDFNVNFKVKPPLREQTDIDALWEGLQDGTIDIISSNHVPVEEEHKKLEFPYADFGAIGLETTFPLVNTYLNNRLSLEQFVQKISITPRKLLHLPTLSIKEGAMARLTIFNPTTSWIFEKKDIQSKSKNSPLIGQTFKGKVLGIINGTFNVLLN